MSLHPNRVAMLLSNPFRPDPRVLKEARSLVNHGFEVIVICWDREGDYPKSEVIEGIQINRIRVRSTYGAGVRQLLKLPLFWLKAFKVLSGLKADLIHCHDLDTLPLGFLFAKLTNKKVVFDAHECYPDLVYRQVPPWEYRMLLILERFLAKRADHVLTVGSLLAERYRQLGAKVSVVGNYQVWNPTLCTICRELRDELGISEDALLIAYIGGFTYGRLILPLIEAVKGCKGVHLILAGIGPQKADILTYIAGADNIRYLGYIPQERVMDYTKAADVLYYGLDSSYLNNRYSSPNALYNALAAGRPLITTDVGEIGRIVREEHCGIVIEEATPQAIAEAITQLCDSEYRQMLSANALQAAKGKYNWARAEQELLKVYRGLIGDKIK